MVSFLAGIYNQDGFLSITYISSNETTLVWLNQQAATAATVPLIQVL